MNIVTIKMVMMHILTYAVLDYIDNLPVLFVINVLNILMTTFACIPVVKNYYGAFSDKLKESCKN